MTLLPKDRKSLRSVRQLAAGLAAILVLTACAGPTPADLQGAEQFARTIIERRLPSIPPGPAANCVVDLASEAETDALVLGGKGAETGANAQLVITILARPEGRACLANNGITDFG